MAMLRMKVPCKKPYRAYLPEELLEEGFVGDVEILADAFTATMIKPGANLSQVKESLQIMIKDIDLRRRGVENGKKEGPHADRG